MKTYPPVSKKKKKKKKDGRQRTASRAPPCKTGATTSFLSHKNSPVNNSEKESPRRVAGHSHLLRFFVSFPSSSELRESHLFPHVRCSEPRGVLMALYKSRKQHSNMTWRPWKSEVRKRIPALWCCRSLSRCQGPRFKTPAPSAHAVRTDDSPLKCGRRAGGQKQTFCWCSGSLQRVTR